MPTLLKQELLRFLLCVMLNTILLCTSPTKGIRCEETSIGVEARGIIPDSSFTASSTYRYKGYKPYFARIGDTRGDGHGWCPGSPEKNIRHYLQIDLGAEYVVCAIATKEGGAYAKTYVITMSKDNRTWTDYKENGRIKVFDANKDSTGVVKSSLKNKPLMRYIRLYHFNKCIKAAIYGYARIEECITNPLGMSSGDIINDRLSPSSFQRLTINPRLHSKSCWCPESRDFTPYLTIDLGSHHVICAVATQGCNIADRWVKSYHISISSNGILWSLYKENNVTRIFYGNHDRSTISHQLLYHSPTARYVRIAPQAYHGAPCLRMEIYGYQLESTCSKHSVGVPSASIIPNHRFKATSYGQYDRPYMARLQGYSSLGLSAEASTQYLEIDLGKIFRICAVLTQGDHTHRHWFTKYSLRYSDDNKLWKTYKKLDGKEKVFPGNSDKETIVTNVIKYPFKAKFVRVVPKGSLWKRALRVDFKGTPEVCTNPLGVENRGISDPQMTSSSSKDSSHVASRGRLYGKSAWCSATSSNAEYIQVDLGRVKTVTGIATQGYPSKDKWVTSYNLIYSINSDLWLNYTEQDVTKALIGNTNKHEVIVNWLGRPIAARYVRIIPQKNKGDNCLRLDLYGCDFVKLLKAALNTNSITLPSIKGSFQTLKCTVIGETSPTFQWFRNGSTKLPGTTKNTLKVKFISAQDIKSTYKCKRGDPSLRLVVCKMNYTCRATLQLDAPSVAPAEATTQLTVNLNVPEKQLFSITSRKRSLTINWTPAVQLDDVGAIVGYTIKLNDKETQVRSNQTQHIFTGLKPYTNYTLQMKATSMVGEGLWSDVKTAATLIAKPERLPTVFATANSSKSIKVTWEVRAAKVNGPMAGFWITFTDALGNTNTKQVPNIRRTVLTNLKKWTTYNITVSIWNSRYYGPESSIVSETTHEDAPDCSPKMKSTEALSSTSIRVTWEPLPNTYCRNGILRGYKVLYRRQGTRNTQMANISADVHSKVITDLQKYTMYLFSVVAYTVKDSEPSNTISKRTKEDAPDCRPKLKSVKVLSSTSISATWQPLPNTTCRNGILRGYKVVYRRHGVHDAQMVNIGAHIHSMVIKDLQKYTTYIFSIVAHTVKDSNQSNIITRTTFQDAPDCRPKLKSVEALSSTSIRVTWDPLPNTNCRNGILRDYKVFYRRYGVRNAQMDVTGADVNSMVISDLQKYTTYIFTVVAYTVKNSKPSNEISRRTLQDAPDCPPKLKSVKVLSSTSIRVTWHPLPNTNCSNGILRGYKVLYRKHSVRNTQMANISADVHSKVITDLQKYTTYIIKVAAYTVKDSKPSDSISRTTLQDAPSVPLNDKAKLIQPNDKSRIPRVQVTWDKPSHDNGIITRYTLVYRYDNDTSNHVNITDISSLVYTLDVLGQAWFWFKMSASTIKEGHYTAIKSLWIPAYAPHVAPQGIKATKKNETTFIINWKPLRRNEANGIITKYKISWILRHIGRAKRTAVRESFTGTAQGNQFVLHNLRRCAQYEVRVAAATVAGLGPNATHNITTSKPGAPHNLESRGVGKAFITLSWRKPKAMITKVKSYKIYFKGSKSYWPVYSSPLKTKTQDGKQTTLKIGDLQPGTYYEFWVIALTVCGESNRSLTVTEETKVDKPRAPQFRAPMNLKDSFNVTLWTFKPHNGPISSYQVIVISGSNKSMTEIPENLSNYEKAKENDKVMYVTAELTLFQIKTTMFFIGDNQMYGTYKNVALGKGQVYTIAERAITRYKGKVYVSDPVHIATIELSAELMKKLEESKTTSSSDVAIGVVVSLLVIVVILALLGFKYKRRRDTKNDCPAISLDDLNNESEGNHQESSAENKNDNELYVNVDVRGHAGAIKPMTKRRFMEFMKSLKINDYSELKEEFRMLSNAHAFPVDIAKKPANKKKNRYANIVTYDNSRVVISRQADDEHSDYINASYIKGYDGSTKKYIATQGPTPQTVADFWQMIWEVNSCTIVMLTNLKEGSKAKCHQYWSEDKETHRDITVIIQKSEVFPDYVIRTLLLTKSNTNESLEVNHFQFTVWPDHGVPQYSTAVLGLRRQVNALNPDHAGPLVVHCSAGVGRTGAYIVIDAMLERAKHLKNVAIPDYVASIRNDRPYMVQTEEQYVFIHLSLNEVFTCGNTEFPVYNLQNTMRKLSKTAPERNNIGYALEFEKLNRATHDYAKEERDVGSSLINIKKNRDKDNIALNCSRVLLNKPGEDVTTSYINASHVDAYKERNAFIVTQAPLKKTIEDFWIMVASYDVSMIVMLNNVQEENKHFIQYWPESGSSSYGHVTVELLDTTTIGQLISRHLKVTYGASTFQVLHIQMPNWKDKRVPSNSQSVLALINEVEQSQRHAQCNHSPIVVQCSNGIGRSGTFCAIYSIIERVKQEQMVDVFQAVKGIRTNRPGAVETLDQYVYCYTIIQDYLDSFSDYANFTN